jgi:hypothetical protein
VWKRKGGELITTNGNYDIAGMKESQQIVFFIETSGVGKLMYCTSSIELLERHERTRSTTDKIEIDIANIANSSMQVLTIGCFSIHPTITIVSYPRTSMPEPPEHFFRPVKWLLRMRK